MAQRIVQIFVAIQIAHAAGQIVPVPLGFVEVGLGDLGKLPPVGQPGQVIGLGHGLQLLEGLLQLDVLDAQLTEHRLQLVLQPLVLPPDAKLPQILFDDGRNSKQVVAQLENVVLSPAPKGFPDRNRRILACQKDHRHVGTLADTLDQIQSRDIRKIRVKKDNGELFQGLGQTVLARCDTDDLPLIRRQPVMGREHLDQQFVLLGVVLDNQNLRHVARRFTHCGALLMLLLG